jgi:Flp pilus assembly pilin Flp
MTFTSMIKTFAADESGAVTVDWVVLTAAIVGLGLAVITSVRTGVTALGSDISNSLSSASVATLGTLGTN